MFKNPTVKNGLRIATIGGSSILAIGAVYHLITKTKKWQDVIVPGLVLLVSATAFTSAMATDSVAPNPAAPDTHTKSEPVK